MSIFLLPFFVMSHLCASDFSMPYFWSRAYYDVNGHDFFVKGSPGSDLCSYFACGNSAEDLVKLSFGHGRLYFHMWCTGSTLLEVSKACHCVQDMSTGYVFNAPLNGDVGGLGIVTPTVQPVAPPRFSRLNSRQPKTFCDYRVDETSFSAKVRLCEYNEGGFFFVSAKCVYKDRNNIVVSWGEEMPCGRIKAESFDECKFSFNACSHESHSSESTGADLDRKNKQQ